MNLVIDIGNTRTKLGLFSGKELAEKEVWTDWTTAELVRWGNEAGVQNVLLSSVTATDEGLMQALQEEFRALELSHTTPLPFRNAYRTPKTLGKDRLAAVAGAHALFPGEDCLVVDCGTCIKYDLLTAAGDYLGGNIAPGALMRIRAMHHFTARLPEVPMGMPEGMIGDSTETALQNGALRGAALEIEGVVRMFRREYSALRTILCGGDAAFFKPYLAIEHIDDQPDIILIGLNHILQHQLPFKN